MQPSGIIYLNKMNIVMHTKTYSELLQTCNMERVALDYF